MNKTYNFTWDYSTPPVGLALEYPYYQHLYYGDNFAVNGKVYTTNVFGNINGELSSSQYTTRRFPSIYTPNSFTPHDVRVTYTLPNNEVTGQIYSLIKVPTEQKPANTSWNVYSLTYSPGGVSFDLDFANNTITTTNPAVAGNLPSNFTQADTNNTIKYFLLPYSSGNFGPEYSNSFERYVGYDANRRFFCDIVFNNVTSGPGWKVIIIDKNGNRTSGVVDYNSGGSFYPTVWTKINTSSERATPLFDILIAPLDADLKTIPGNVIEIHVYAWPINGTYMCDYKSTLPDINAGAFRMSLTLNIADGWTAD